MTDVLPDLPYVAAKWQRAGRRGKKPRLIVLHSTESPEAAKGAENVARYFSTATRVGSSHVVVDNDSVVRCVHDADTAMGAAGANDDGLHIEQCGYAKQSEGEWLDPYDLAMFAVTGPLVRAWAKAYEIPLRWLTVAQVADGKTKGLCTHADVSAAFPAQSTGHTDPGPNYPKARVLAIWTGTEPPNPEEPDMTPDQEAQLARVEKLLEGMSPGLSVYGDNQDNLNDYRILADGSVVQIINGAIRRDFHTKAVVGSLTDETYTDTSKGGRTRVDFTVELPSPKGTVRWFTYDPSRPGFPGPVPGGVLVDGGDGWHYADIAG